MNAFFDGYVNSKTTLKQFVEQYDNALRRKVEKEIKADFKSRNKLYDCFNEEGAICTYHVKEAVLVGEKMKTVEFVVYFNASECELHCMCRWFEFRGIMYAHAIIVLLERCIYQVLDKYIVSRWRKDIERGYTCIPTTYTKAGVVHNAKLHDKYHKMLHEIIEIAANDDGKHEVLDLGLIEIKDRVRKYQSGSASHAPPSTSNVPPSTSNVPPSHSSLRSPSARSTTKASMSRKMLSPMVARRRGRPCTKQKVSKVDEIVNRLKGKNKKATKSTSYASGYVNESA
ncbi:protein FAR1-RELATED SEQUENCE 8-like [Camellia sinensis]|uniref:protein FAR1-RELATED SEQUENCE 8-like n=1 Tax=Camellia sinensis TaxID=4442 RepID=UPI0010355D30|nr:protein FAR1-RELATED SEQUENCE 8-like [Camellia sinensis]